ncbi:MULTISPECIES: hypothetical protein [Metallosphaera]|uniref:Uncharacterized protein n=3 Tax=Metallosphaera TaxID=41980 RepID=A4YGV2_METS5|nr:MULTISPECIES: hypothetical protein [Metallosphaera]ABP95654.1 hypothetical protein Msed_1497 [Metallosphaera sedula DSM 5348]AIM27638.1 hypothetical protein HA72_1497 [Metallosphaera sedula]AKV74494.1 hypothetical protein MsedA_1518 [Metallosphaera sedula]AKV76733.1 hypothetical protein MsedB_1520 [Metallosphaera sedula]AKV78984.1 hypothetical protein MsedC_1518 [Metallosphaera sedula]
MSFRDQILLYLYFHGEARLGRLMKEFRVDEDDLLSVLRPMELEGLISKKLKGVLKKETFYTLTEKGILEARKIDDSL